jgi:hypothetical protein
MCASMCSDSVRWGWMSCEGTSGMCIYGHNPTNFLLVACPYNHE